MYDAVIVGARCAGASLAMLLGRQGLKVLMLDGSSFPSDKITSTHFIWQSGVACMTRWGLIEKLEATNCPSHDNYVLDMGGLELRGGVKTEDGGVTTSYAPRRHVIDNLLIEEARAAGVEFEDEAKVVELLKDGGRVVGLRYRNKDQETVEVSSRIVVGADGIKSTIAELAGAETYNYHEKSQQIFFSYFKNTDLTTVEFYSRPGRMGFAWPSNDGEVVAGFCCRGEDAEKMTGDIVGNYWSELEAMSPDFCARLKAADQTAPVRTGGTPSYMRTAGGPGWALTGDAGMNMDPVSASGISNAFIQAEMLSEAIADGVKNDRLDENIAKFGSERDARFAAYFAFTADLAKLEPETPDEIVQLFVAMASQQEEAEAYFGVFAQTVPVMEFFDPENMARIIANANSETAVA